MFLLHKMYVSRRDFGFWFYSYLRVRKLIRGEAMNREIGVYERKKYPGQFLFGMGFLIGVILPNFIYRTQWRQSTASSMYLMGILAGDNSAEYFWQVLKMRGGIFLLAACSGVTIFGMPLAIMGMLAGGVLIGMLLTVSVWSEWRPDRCRTSFSPVSSVSAMHVYRTGTDLQLFKKTVEEPFFFSRTDYRISSENAVLCGTLSGGDSPGSIL